MQQAPSWLALSASGSGVWQLAGTPTAASSEPLSASVQFQDGRGGSVTQLVRISDWTGTAMFHCHIVEHEDIGMLGLWEIA